MNPNVNDFLSRATLWQDEMKQLRAFILDCGLQEDFKWRQPCYTYQGNNIAIMGALKNCCVLGFFKGVLLSDSEKLLVSPGENSKSVKQFKFSSLKDIMVLEKTIKAYLYEAIEIERTGLKVPNAENEVVEYPHELEIAFDRNPALKSAFTNLTKGRQRGYIMFIKAAKQSATRASRIEKNKDRILMGKGINDCICGASKRMPNCDGSHKYL